MKTLEDFEEWELRHLKKRTFDFGLSSVRLKISDYLEDKSKINKLEEALSRLSEISSLSKTCKRADCEVCKKVENLKPERSFEEKWELSLELWKWQKECREKWIENGGEGIVKVVTGAGKTILALAITSYLKNKSIYSEEGLKNIIVVPNTALLDQWYSETKDLLNLEDYEIGVFYGEEKDNIAEKNLMIYVLNSARRHLKKHLKNIDDDIFLIADECHRFASEKSKELFERTFDYTLGLSATPEREADFGFEKVLEPNLGKVIYEYNYSRAREDGIIPPFHLKRIEVPLQKREETRYQEYSDRLDNLFTILVNRYPELDECNQEDFLKTLGRLQKIHEDNALENYTLLANQRKEIIHESISKMSALRYLIDNEISKNSRVLIFHERKKSANKIQEFLQKEEYKSGLYHTDVTPSKRRESLEKYRNKELNILVTCKALDEGLDVPDTDVGIIAAATSSVRQRIQRIGRILRRSPGKNYAQIYTIYIKDKEERIFERPQMKDLQRTADVVEEQKLEF